jgi:hypothetical protein
MTGSDEVTVRVAGVLDDDDEELAVATARLREELLALEVDDVEPLAGEGAPDGAKGLSLALGALLVKLGSGVPLRAVLDVLQRWARANRRDVEVTLDGNTLRLTSVSAEQQDKIIDVWLARHAGGG